MEQSYSWREWEEMTRPYHLTIQDINDMPTGETRTFICLDRNVWDITLSDNEQHPLPRDPIEFFKENTISFTKGIGLEGNTLFSWGEDCSNWEFDINYESNSWFPLRDGNLPRMDYQRGAVFPWNKTPPEDERLSWRMWPNSTRVGWRGPMVKMSPNLPLIIYNADD